MTYSESERKVLARARRIKAKKRNAAKKARPVSRWRDDKQQPAHTRDMK